MADLAELGFVVKDQPLARAEDRLDRLVPAADKAAKATDRFNKAASESPSATNRMASGLSNLTTVALKFATGIAAAFSISMLANYADAWSDMQSRVGAAIKDMEAAPALMQRLVDVANASYSPLAQTVEIYGRNVAVLKDLGRTAAETADFTESLNHMLVITATRGERAEAVQNALSKAMAVGKLQADGLETVLANGGRVAEALAAELGTTVSNLRKFAAEGKITGSVIANAIIKPLEDVREQAGGMAATITDAFVILNNNVTQAIGTLDKATGASSAVASAIIYLAENLHLVVAGVSALAVALTVALLPAIGAATGAFLAFTAALLANPLTWLALAAGGLTAAFITLNKTTWEIEAGIKNANAAYATNEAAMKASMEASGGYTAALRNQVAMQIEAAKSALTLAEAENAAAYARSENFKKTFGFGFEPLDYAVRETGIRLRVMDEAFFKLNEQLSTIDSNIIDSPIVPTLNAAAGAAGAANDNTKKLTESTGYLKDAQRQLNEQYEFGKSTLGSFFSDLKSGITSGESMWESFGKAAVNALDRIANKALEMASNSIWDMIFGAIGGNFIGGTAGAAPLQLGFQKGIPGFATGGYTGDGSNSSVAGLVHANEFVLNSDATRRIGVGTLQAMNDNMALPSNDNGGGLYVTFSPNYYIDGVGLTMEQLQEVLARNNEQLMDDLPNQLKAVQLDRHKRVVRG